MNNLRAIIWLLAIVLGLGISVMGLPQTANAQTDKDQKEKKQEIEDEDEESDEDLSPEDRQKVQISLEFARAIALAKVPGTVLEEELEKERDRLQYAFDIRSEDGKLFDVEIDAITGEILQAIEEDDDDEDVDVKENKKTVVKKNVVERTVTIIKTKPQ